MTYNLLYGHLDIDESLFFTGSWNTTRGHIYKLFKLSTVKDFKRRFFLNEWCQNGIPFHVM